MAIIGSSRSDNRSESRSRRGNVVPPDAELDDDRSDEPDDDERDRGNSRRAERPRAESRGRSSRDDRDDDRDRDRDEPRGRDRGRSRDDDRDEPRRSRDDRDRDRDEPRSRRGRDDDRDEPRGRDRDDDRGRSRDRDDERSRDRGRDRDEPRGRRRASDDDRDDDRPVRRRPADRDDDRDSGRGSRSSSRGSALGDDDVASGWDGARENGQRAEAYPRYTVARNAKPVLVTFVETGPFLSIREHWFDNKDKRKGYICLHSIKRDGKPRECPLDEIDSATKPFDFFNIVVFNDEGIPELKVLKASPTVSKRLRQLSEQDPLDQSYFAISSTGPEAGRKGRVDYDIYPVSESDVDRKWNIEPLSDRDLDQFYEDRFTKEIIRGDLVNEDELRLVRDEVSGESRR